MYDGMVVIFPYTGDGLPVMLWTKPEVDERLKADEVGTKWFQSVEALGIDV